MDIVIGTHRVLSADVEFKDLGLLIIDEEQRFFVGHADSAYPAHESHRHPGHERAGGSAPGSSAHPDLCDGI